MACGQRRHRRGGLGLMPRIAKLLCVMAFLFTWAPGTVLPAHAAMPMARGVVVGMGVSHPCQPDPMAFMPQAAPLSPMAADGCCQGLFACSPCAEAVPGFLPPVAMLLPSSVRAGRSFGPTAEDKLPGQIIPPAAPPPRPLA